MGENDCINPATWTVTHDGPSTRKLGSQATKEACSKRAAKLSPKSFSSLVTVTNYNGWLIICLEISAISHIVAKSLNAKWLVHHHIFISALSLNGLANQVLLLSLPLAASQSAAAGSVRTGDGAEVLSAFSCEKTLSLKNSRLKFRSISYLV